jgi:hypothetical protein
VVVVVVVIRACVMPGHIELEACQVTSAKGAEGAGCFPVGGKGPEHKPWEMYEFALSDPDGTLVRLGWPGELCQK